MDEKQMEDLLNRYQDGKTTSEENLLVQSLFNRMVAGLAAPNLLPEDESRRDRIWAGIGIRNKPRQVFPLFKYAAAALVVLAGFTWFYVNHYKHTSLKPMAQVIQDYKPGGNKAILTLANGTEVSLQSHSGSVAKTSLNAGVLISNNATTGIVTFSFKPGNMGGTENTASESASLNTITTPRSGQYQLVLSDGTRVFLNAESKISFPSRFAGPNRQVSVIGEAYFEVAKDKQHPFRVITEDQQLTVTGTHFNVNAYPGEPVKTTLTEGGVKLLQPSTGKSLTLIPDQQATLLSKNGFNVKTVDPSVELAWKDGMFIFDSIPLKQAMQQISRWYDVEVEYSTLPEMTIEGSVYRSLSLEQLLKAMNLFGNFELKGRRLVYHK